MAAGRQTAGHGRLGRKWADDCGLGVAMTFVLDAREYDPGYVSIAAGVAAAHAASAALGGEDRPGSLSQGRPMLRWPNDVVIRSEQSERKLAGVLVEHDDGLIYVGIGMNVEQQERDFELSVRDVAVSLRMLGSTWSRDAIAGRLVRCFARVLRDTGASLASEWRALDVLIGTKRTFVHDRKEYIGRVQSIDPTAEIVLETAGGVRRLPALTTSLVG